jgi:hypothetical protein
MRRYRNSGGTKGMSQVAKVMFVAFFNSSDWSYFLRLQIANTSLDIRESFFQALYQGLHFFPLLHHALQHLYVIRLQRFLSRTKLVGIL